MRTSYRFEVALDPEAGVWYVAESTLPGLHTEAPTLDELVARLQRMVPDLLEAMAECEGIPDGSSIVPLEVILHTLSGRNAAA